MSRIRPDVDIVLNILKAVAEARPDSAFINSLLFQYRERGGLSKKQLQGLYGKACKLSSVSPSNLATLEAIIMKKPQRFRSELPGSSPLYERDPAIGELIRAILQKFPEHKRALFLKSKYDHNEVLSDQELADLRRFGKLLK